MVKFAANLSLLYTDRPFLDRFDAAANAGFAAVEFMFPYDYPAEAVTERVQAAGVDVVLFNTPAGDWNNGERGLGAMPERIAQCRTGVTTAIEYAVAMGCPRLHLMAGKAPRLAENQQVLIDNVRYAADAAQEHGIEILLEPINTRIDIPGYFYDNTADVMAIMTEIDRSNVKLQYDIYHMQIMEGDILRTIERLMPAIGHIQVADNPGRHEPGTGELNYPNIFKQLDSMGYAGWVGCEYNPVADTDDGLDWALPYLQTDKGKRQA
ncbi:hydroxypyruvate isomerase [Croceicoccus estronivorus]|uniref:2-oxo-tetronate isomerase n=1 Tax=Croceicoccus estronivorus TaxID=1172626 RepID=UPI00083031F8|nr:2-oxo-tetronate isomerase [Croceicoccus estronivorus]OCC24444.1 hydroxypyruvate isomerase [Croceicoccus estronivorus]